MRRKRRFKHVLNPSGSKIYSGRNLSVVCTTSKVRGKEVVGYLSVHHKKGMSDTEDRAAKIFISFKIRYAIIASHDDLMSIMTCLDFSNTKFWKRYSGRFFVVKIS